MLTTVLCISLLAFGVGGKVTHSGFEETTWHRSQPPSNLSPPKVFKGSITAMIVDSMPPVSNVKITSKQKLKSGRAEEECWRCPQNRTVMAPRRRDFVTMESPPLKPCHRNSLRSGGRVKVAVVYGPRPGTILGEGSHPVLLKVNSEQICYFNYNVMVRKCGQLPPREGLSASCSAKNLWGSECIFSCEQGHQLVGYRKTHCNRNLKWTHPPPTCRIIARNDCTVPVSPENGYLSCWNPEEGLVRLKGMLPDGSSCQYHCHKGYKIPTAQNNLAVTYCNKGHWDTTQDPICLAVEDSFNTVLKNKTGKLKKNIRRQHADSCFPGICRNGGKCLIALGEARCLCAAGYTGPTCTSEI